MREYEEYEADEPFVVIEKRSGSAGSFFWGIALGAGLALLLAPRSGAETRRELKRGARRVRTAARETAEELADSVVDRYEHARHSVGEQVDSARRAINLKKRQASEAIRAGREAAQQARDELERRIAETKAAYQAGADVARSSRTSGVDEETGT
ncbi:MAG TPA: YtxH domain-containing protein [Gemmatimonadaceae bacterium]|nr:YtxH domain-containing protein [Gemmatimonadaceae bacterium]